MRLLRTICLLVLPVSALAQHPLTFFTRAEATSIKNDLARYPLLTSSFKAMKQETDAMIVKEISVPFPKDPAGGFTHDRHKSNYMLMFNSGVLYNLTGDVKYANWVRKMLLKYAALNPALPKHPQATSSSPGRLFWQALNDANWLVYTGMAYDLIYNTIPATDKKTIEEGAFKPEVDFLTKDLKTWFNLIHNHGVWACAGVGIVGIATNNKDYVDMALYGTDKNGKGGFLSQMENLFSPDGYYTEGPYYVRYAILPYYLFANALNHARPGLKIFQHRDRVLQKALVAGLQQTNIDGRFFPLNDALKEKDYTSNELVTAIGIAWDVYGQDRGWLAVAKRQNRVILNKGGASIAAAMVREKSANLTFPYKTVEYGDGANGREGGVSLLRNGANEDLTSLIYKYTSHGLSHGHFDKLNINLFDKGNEVLTDYGSVRFVGIEQKYGGRYLSENDAYAAQTIAHNTLVVDETSHFGGNEKRGERYHSDKVYSSIANPALQVVIAKEENAYDNVKMLRSVYMLQLASGRKFIVDIFNVNSPETHQYDLPFHYEGQLIHTSFRYEPYTNQQRPLGNKNGYQFLWKEAEARVFDTTVQFTFLNNRSYYSISSWVPDSATLIFARTGANDPQFNLRHEPAFILRKRAASNLFINVIEIHGKYDPVMEFSMNAYPSVQRIEVSQNDKEYTIATIMIDGKRLMITQSNSVFEKDRVHSAGGVQWNGPFNVTFDGKNLN
ncbi:MAG: alginate lyase family protein [Chitinophagaceae bacterium]|nr:alginate lyase family protein [Chitinophagaceae bacterium]